MLVWLLSEISKLFLLKIPICESHLLTLIYITWKKELFWRTKMGSKLNAVQPFQNLAKCFNNHLSR